jgi:hypothetical protein
MEKQEDPFVKEWHKKEDRRKKIITVVSICCLTFSIVANCYTCSKKRDTRKNASQNRSHTEYNHNGLSNQPSFPGKSDFSTHSITQFPLAATILNMPELLQFPQCIMDNREVKVFGRDTTIVNRNGFTHLPQFQQNSNTPISRFDQPVFIQIFHCGLSFCLTPRI